MYGFGLFFDFRFQKNHNFCASKSKAENRGDQSKTDCENKQPYLKFKCFKQLFFIKSRLPHPIKQEWHNTICLD